MQKKSNDSSNIFIIDTDDDRRLNISNVLESQGFAASSFSSIEAVKNAFDTKQASLIFIHRRLLEQGYINGLTNMNATVVVMSPSDLKTDLSVCELPYKLSQIIFYDRPNKFLSAKLIQATAKKFIEKKYFGLNQYLNQATIISEQVDVSIHRSNYLDKLKEFFNQCNVNNPYISSKSELICEELLSNAYYLSNEEKHNKNAKAPILAYGFEDGVLGLSVTDFYGSLDISSISKYLRNSFSEGDFSLSTNPMRGGLGFFEITSSCDAFIVNVSPEKKTEAISLIDTTSPQKSLKNLYAFQYFTTHSD